MTDTKVSLLIWPFLLGCLLVSCQTNTQEVVNDRLSSLDSLITTNPSAAWDSLSSFDFKALSRKERAYAQLLYTIAQHKSGIPFEDASIIEESRSIYENLDDDYNYVRSLFYNGLVLYKIGSPSSAQSLSHFLEAKTIIAENDINDIRLEALIDAYIGRIHSRNNNFEEAEKYCRSAIEKESRAGNIRNMLLDQCELVTLLIKAHKDSSASIAMTELDRMMIESPGSSSNAVYNTKAIYYSHSYKNADSALFYCMKWQPSPMDECAKQSLIAQAFREKGQADSSIVHEKAALNSKRAGDTLSHYIYYKNLATCYDQIGNKDSSAHYAFLAYEALHDTHERTVDKRILELEKQYEVATRDAQIEQLTTSRRIAFLIAFILFVVVVLLLLLVRASRKKIEYAKQNDYLLQVQQRQLEEERLVLSVLMSTAKTYQFVTPRLKRLVNQAVSMRSPLQDPLSEMLDTLKRDNLRNLTEALEKSEMPVRNTVWERILVLLSTPQEKAVFLLTEMGYSPSEIQQAIGTTADSIRSTKSYIRKKIQDSSLIGATDSIGLRIINKGDSSKNSQLGVGERYWFSSDYETIIRIMGE